MDPCVTCGTTEETTSVCTCDCQCLETVRRSGCREIKLIAPTRDTATAWAENDPIVPEGVFFLVKDRLFEGSLEYAIGDGESKYSELSMLYAGAPLSRTGAQNHSPLAASGKSTLDPSWLPDATSSAKGAVMTSTTGTAGKVPIPASESSTLDPSWFPEATSTTLGAVKASTTTAANNVVKADGNGSLTGWKDAIIDAITANDGSGGLVTDSNGNLAVDFSQMPTDKFEALLKGLKMQIPLEADLNLFVDKNHSAAGDTIIDGRGTASKPFKTIQACINYATLTYAVGRYNIYIYIAQATYNEGLALPTFTRTSGTISLRAADDNAPPTITNPGPATSLVTATGGNWTLRRLNLSASWSDPNTGTNNYLNVIGASQGAILTVYGCALSAEYVGAASANRVRMVVVYATGNGSVSLGVMAGFHNSLSCTIGNANNACMILTERNGTITFPNANIDDDGIAYDIPCSGTVSVFAQATEKCSITTSGGGLRGQAFSGTVIGKKYQCSVLSTIRAPYGGFPGSTEGTVDASTFSTYSEAAS